MSKPTKVRPVMNSQQKAINVTLVCTGNLNSNKDDDDDHGGTSYENDYFDLASMHPPSKKNDPQTEVVGLARIDVGNGTSAGSIEKKRNGQQTEGGM